MVALALTEYVENCDVARVAIVKGVDGEVFPCGCATNQTGGLVSLMPAIRTVEPDHVAFLGDNYSPRTLTAHALERVPEFYRHRHRFVRSTLGSLGATSEITTARESRTAADQQSLGEDQFHVEVGGIGFEFTLSRADAYREPELGNETSQQANAANDVRLMLVSGDAFQQRVSLRQFDHVLWFTNTSQTTPPYISRVPDPLSGGRSFAVVSVRVPSNPGAKHRIVLENEFRTLAMAIDRAAVRDNTAFYERLCTKAQAL